MDELDFIERLRPLSGPGSLNFEDDAAILTAPHGHDLVVSKDTMVEGVHFPSGRIGGGFSERLLRVALSDLAAKGARPLSYMLSVAWPRGRDPKWMQGFVTGLRHAQDAFDLSLLGGDTTATDCRLVATATVFGVVPEGCMVTRSGAKVGNCLWHTGQLGLAKIGLDIVQGHPVTVTGDQFLAAEEAYLRPEPRFAIRKLLRQHATACADISDGLIIEAGHLASASQVRIDLTRPLPVGHDFGDDYELLFTAPKDATPDMLRQADKLGVSITPCGVVREGSGVWMDGRELSDREGYRHSF